MDYGATLYGPAYAAFGVVAVLTIEATAYSVTAIDKTAGVDIGDNGAQVQTIKPAAVVRVPELLALGVALETLSDATLTLNGFTWAVTTYRVKPSPHGENDGEVLLILADKTPALVTA